MLRVTFTDLPVKCIGAFLLPPLQVKKCVSCLSTCIFPDKTTYPIDETMVGLLWYRASFGVDTLLICLFVSCPERFHPLLGKLSHAKKKKNSGPNELFEQMTYHCITISKPKISLSLSLSLSLYLYL